MTMEFETFVKHHKNATHFFVAFGKFFNEEKEQKILQKNDK